MRLTAESELFLKPRFSVSFERFSGAAAHKDSNAATAAAAATPPAWRIRCCLPPEGGEATGSGIQSIYGRYQAGQIYLTDTAQRLADAVMSKTTATALDSTRPGKRHVSFALGAALLDMLLVRKELLHNGQIIVDISDIVADDWISHLDEFALAMIVRSAKPSLSRQKSRNDNDSVHVRLRISETALSAFPQINLEDCLTQAQTLAEAMLWTRSLVNAPPNVLRPDSFEKIVTEMMRQKEDDGTQKFETRLEVYRGAALAELNCKLLQAVGRGSTVEPRLMKLTLRFAASDDKHGLNPRPRVAIVGKGITFDSGGYDIKPSSAMRNMKKDMGGAAAAVGVFLAAAGLDLGVDLDVYLCLAENMISGDAFRPGDMITARDGSLIEIENTDAEGRLVLADALHLAAETRPDWILDFATLTGAARVALGPEVDALLSNEADLALLVTSSGVETGDWVWHLPRVPSYQKMLESSVGDLMNASASGHAGALTAALFLERFVGRTPWTHIDTFMWSEKPGSLTAIEAGATAKCVRLTCEALRRYTKTRALQNK